MMLLRCSDANAGADANVDVDGTATMLELLFFFTVLPVLLVLPVLRVVSNENAAKEGIACETQPTSIGKCTIPFFVLLPLFGSFSHFCYMELLLLL